jgi:hypothetical protein
MGMVNLNPKPAKALYLYWGLQSNRTEWALANDPAIREG